MAPTRLLIALMDPTVCLKISGRANFTLSLDFKSVVNELMLRGRSQFILDLTECLIMDSTFLGVLAGLSRKLEQIHPGKSDPVIQLLNPNSLISDLLDNLGIAHLFPTLHGAPPLAPYSETTPQPSTPIQIKRATFEAHQVLMELNPANVPKFKDVAQFLAEDLKKLDSKPGNEG